jgi:dolichol-phosphate mannosyltransferase
MDLSVIIPCYNEAENVPKIQRELLPVLAWLAKTSSVEVIFVDDGSQDNTWQAFHAAFANKKIANLDFRFEKHEHNRGLGAALRTGFAAARGNVVMTTDSDGTYAFAEIPSMLSSLKPDMDIVVASPYHPKGKVVGVPAYRLLFSRGSSMIYRLLVSWNLHTYTSLFRVYRRHVIKSIQFESDGFLAGTEILVKAMLAGYQFSEYPAVLYSRVFGESKAKIMRTIKAHLRFQFRVLLHRLHIAPFSLVHAPEGSERWA